MKASNSSAFFNSLLNASMDIRASYFSSSKRESESSSRAMSSSDSESSLDSLLTYLRDFFSSYFYWL